RRRHRRSVAADSVGLRRGARRLPPRQGRLRGRLRGIAPARLGRHPAGRHPPHSRAGRADVSIDTPLEQLVRGEHADPHRVLGLHDGVVTAYRPGASAMSVLAGAKVVEMQRVHPAGVFRTTVRGLDAYRLQVRYADGSVDIDDPYRFWPTV